MVAGERATEAGGLYLRETIALREASDAELHVARQALAAVPGWPDRLAYARVDLIPGPNGSPCSSSSS